MQIVGIQLAHINVFVGMVFIRMDFFVKVYATVFFYS